MALSSDIELLPLLASNIHISKSSFSLESDSIYKEIEHCQFIHSFTHQAFGDDTRQPNDLSDDVNGILSEK